MRLEQRTLEALTALQAHFRPGLALGALARARDWQAIARGRTKAEAVRAIAARLAAPHWAKTLTPDGQPVRVPPGDLVPRAGAGRWSDEPAPEGIGSDTAHAAAGYI